MSARLSISSPLSLSIPESSEDQRDETISWVAAARKIKMYRRFSESKNAPLGIFLSPENLKSMPSVFWTDESPFRSKE